MVIFSNELKEEDAKKQVKETILQKIEKKKGKITFEDFWGARGFAYTINKQKWGYYFVAQFEADGAILKELERDWNIENSIIRFLISSVDPKAPAPRYYAELKAEYEAAEKANKPEEKSEKPTSGRQKLSTVKKEEKTEDSPAPEKTKEAPKKTEEPKKDDVDKKLDDIINDSALGL